MFFMNKTQSLHKNESVFNLNIHCVHKIISQVFLGDIMGGCCSQDKVEPVEGEDVSNTIKM